MDSLQAFAQLKALLLRRYQEVYPHYRGRLQEFKQKDILNFQLLLEEKVQARVSEKWFYTHLKVDVNNKLPRIDTLNLLARFVGYDSWEIFCHNMEQTTLARSRQPITLKWWWSLLLLLPLAWLVVLNTKEVSPLAEVHLCFVDAIRQTAITEQTVQLAVYSDSQTPLQLQTDKSGCLMLPIIDTEMLLIVTAPYYLPDTVRLSEAEAFKETILLNLQSDDYALMIHYFSNSKVVDWKRRKTQLETVFAENAIIYQIDPEGQLGMDILNKEEFINKLTIPINSLRNVEVLQTKYEAGQVVELRFRVKN